MSDNTRPPELSRREMLGIAAAAAAGAFMIPLPAQASAVSRHVAEQLQQGPYLRKVYTAHEWATVRLLVNYIIPKDDKSGSATDAMVPEFMDTLLKLEPNMQAAHRGGLAWLDDQCRERYGGAFSICTDAHRREMLDAIAWPARAAPELKRGVDWFNSFRDLTATGFFTSKIGIADVGYIGNTALPAWPGCPPDALARLGVHYS